MGREKDITDIKLLKEFGYDKEFLLKALEDWEPKEKIILLLNSLGFDIN